MRRGWSLRDIAAYHKLKVEPQSARRITNRILDALDLLAEFPEMGAVPPSAMIEEAGFRHLILDAYHCFYRILDGQVFVYHIVHGGADYIKRLF